MCDELRHLTSQALWIWFYVHFHVNTYKQL